jgi:hypothetical protein
MGVNYNYRVPKSNLVMLYDFGNPICFNGSGTEVRDISGNGYNGQIENGSPTLSNKKLDFSGLSAYISYDEISLDPPWTSVVVFEQLESSATTSMRQTFFGHTSTSRAGWNRLYLDTSGSNRRVRWITRYQRSSDGAWTEFSSYIGPSGSSYVDPSIQDAFWLNKTFTIITTIDSNYLFSIYLNGEQSYQTQRGSDLSNKMQTNKFGAYGSTSQPFKSNLIAASIYDKALNQNEVRLMHQLYSGRYGI